MEERKYGIECQMCPRSLTIVYGTEEKDEDKVHVHLARLMIEHLKAHPTYKKLIEEDYDTVLKIVKTWVVTLQPHGEQLPPPRSVEAMAR